MTVTVRDAERLMRTLVAQGYGDQILVVGYTPAQLTFGAQPAAEVSSISPGFDWDAGKVFVATAQELGVAGAALKTVQEKQEYLEAQLREAKNVLRSQASVEEKLLALQEVLGAEQVKGCVHD